jgi:hypothetical protein
MIRDNRGVTVLFVMFLTSVILLTFSFWIFSRRGNLENPPSVNLNQDVQIRQGVWEWSGFSNTSLGVNFQYPKNVFINPQIREVPIGNLTRIFLGTGDLGTLSVSVVNRQFDSRNIIDPTAGRISDATAINAAGVVGYQYRVVDNDCQSRVVQLPHGSRIALFAFSSCDEDQQPRVAEDDELMLQILGSIRLSIVISPPVQEESIDSLPPQ